MKNPPSSDKPTEWPPEPERPDPSECCGGGCDPCIMDYYERAVENWKRKIAQYQQARSDED
jgi:hypothetical protein